MSDYMIVNGELYHYGVPGMKWGKRKAVAYANKAANSNELARSWDQKAKRASERGKMNKSAKYAENARIEREVASKYQNKADRMVEKRYAKAGKKAGAADYHREKGNEAYDKHKKNADVFDKAAKKYEAEGNYFKAEAARKSANVIRARGENIKSERYKTADAYMKKSDKLNKKASDFANKTNINLGKKRVDSIINKAKTDGYNKTKRSEEAQREWELEEKLGSNGYETYRRIRGR